MTGEHSMGGLQPNAKMPERVRRRPTPEDWSDDELMTLAEASALFWPDGPLTTTSLRTAVRDQVLEVAEIAGKLLTNKRAIGRMSECRPRRENEPVSPGQQNSVPRSVAEVRAKRALELEKTRMAGSGQTRSK